MPAVAWRQIVERWASDRWLMESLLQFSSSDAARGAAAAWLRAFDAARQAGATEDEAAVIACQSSR